MSKVLSCRLTFRTRILDMPWAIAGGHMSMATHLLLPLENDTSFEYWVKAITERGLFQVQHDMTGLCKFSTVAPPEHVPRP